MTFLLDVNALIALCDPAHVHHELTLKWFLKNGRDNFATCAITENGFIRICSNAAYPNRPGSAKTLQFALQKLYELKGFHFWKDSVSWGTIQLVQEIASKYVTDIYLLALAIKMEGKLVTLDKSIPVTALAEGPEHLLVLNAVN